MDSKTRLLMYKMVNAGILENINGCISTGKESVVFHADGGRLVQVLHVKDKYLGLEQSFPNCSFIKGVARKIHNFRLFNLF